MSVLNALVSQFKKVPSGPNLCQIAKVQRRLSDVNSLGILEILQVWLS